MAMVRWSPTHLFVFYSFYCTITGVSSSTCKLDRCQALQLQDNSLSLRPTGGVAAAILFFFLNLNPHKGRTLRQHVQEFDFLGLLFLVAGIILLLLGFNESETSCKQFLLRFKYQTDWAISTGSSRQTIALLVVGGFCLISGAVNEIFTNRSPIIPPRLFKVSLSLFHFPVPLIDV